MNQESDEKIDILIRIVYQQGYDVGYTSADVDNPYDPHTVEHAQWDDGYDDGARDG